MLSLFPFYGLGNDPRHIRKGGSCNVNLERLPAPSTFLIYAISPPIRKKMHFLLPGSSVQKERLPSK